jgi:geranyl-CoA carboxylase alpha subunit
MSFETILVANRGEIAVRVLRTAKALGYRTVAVYSDADAAAPHVALADDAVLLGPAPVAESYLSVERILAAAAATGAEAVHPGYGFLSENADFARACAEAGVVFIGPSAEAIALMGNKAAAKRRMIAAGVPCVPGYEGEEQSDAAFAAAAARIGFPVLVKAAAGGGGRGMRLVEDVAALPAAAALARAEAESAFGSGELILEKAIRRPRHVEIQVFADAHGGVIHLGERDCSVQRRHQKVVEEAPCPVMTAALRARMGAAAVEAARSIDYRGAGTVEFLLDEEGAFYFLEMNTRLQVEHPVTELVTGFDLVALQIAVAQGAPLGMTQDDVRLAGHAIEVRLYAEDPARDFLPSTGAIDLWQPPAGEGVRVDAGIATGVEVSPFYDAMLAKIVATGASRDIARRRLIAALEDTVLFGPRTNRDFLIAALATDTFAAGTATTAFIAEEFGAAGRPPMPPPAHLATAAVLQLVEERTAHRARAVSVPAGLLNWSSAGALVSRYRYAVDEAEWELAVSPRDATRYAVTLGTDTVLVEVVPRAAQITEVVIDGRRRRARFHRTAAGRVYLSMDGCTVALRALSGAAVAGSEVAGGGRVAAPMHGQLLEVAAAVGDRVRAGDRVAVLEAMKMQHEITAAVDGVVRAVLKHAGEQVAVDDVILEIEIAGD